MKERKVYYISELAHLEDEYLNYKSDTLDNIIATGFCAVALLSTAWMPLLLVNNPSIPDLEKYYSLVLGFGVPSVSAPLMAKNIIKAIDNAKNSRKTFQQLKTHKGRYTFKEIDRYLQEMYEEDEKRRFQKQLSMSKRK